jgi:hypothetical protein
MPIVITDSNHQVTVKYRGEVVDVRTVIVNRNHSDTLDYSDFRMTEITEALVYKGRTKHEWNSALGGEVIIVERPILDRFQWVDCSCLFRDRGQDILEPAVDAIRHPDCVIDYAEYLEAVEQKRIKDAEVALAHKQKRDEADREAERNRPVVGKRMVVTSGRKVKPGTLGTVAFVREGRVLLKDDAKWQDRKADGVWVQERHLKAR